MKLAAGRATLWDETSVILQKGERLMAESTDVQARYKQFLDLLPLTISLAGLPTSDHGKSFSEDQLEARATTIKKAYRQARHIAKACIEG